MEKRELIFDGNEKQVFATDDPDKVIFRYKDVTLAYDGIKRAIFQDKGIISSSISAILLGELNRNGIPTHFIEKAGEREQLCKKIQIIPLEVIVRNRICGSLSRRIGIADGTKALRPILDLRYNNDELGDPLINDYHVIALGLVSEEELKFIYDVASKANDILKEVLHKAGIELVDIKLEFGRASDGSGIIISDEISPDTTRLWEEKTGKPLDKDRFRHDLSDVVASYRFVLESLQKSMK